MLEVYERLEKGVAGVVNTRVLLNHEQRQKGRLRAITSGGEELRVFLDRGRPLQVDEVLRSQCGKNILVEGAMEKVTIGMASDWLTLSKACYHLGNRHVKVQVGDLWLRIKPDHVLEEMLVGLGLSLASDESVFVPESGAYSGSGGHGHSHGNSHEHSHSDGESHEHGSETHVHHAH